MAARDESWEERAESQARRRDEKRRERMPVSGKSVLLLSRIVRPTTRRDVPRRRPLDAVDKKGS